MRIILWRRQVRGTKGIKSWEISSQGEHSGFIISPFWISLFYDLDIRLVAWYFTCSCLYRRPCQTDGQFNFISTLIACEPIDASW